MNLRPGSVAELQDTVRAHAAVTVRGRATKASGTDPAAVSVEVSALSGLLDYSPDECVFTALAGTPLRDLDAALRAHGQHLPFDPPLVETGATIGGTVAAGLSGSERYRYGGIRDFLIGARLVDGEGRLLRSGGQVVKNAAGFLLHHAMVGSHGRLGVLTEVTFKVFPAPEAHATLHVACQTASGAVDAVRAVEGARRDVAALDFDGAGRVWLRVAGRKAGLGARIDRLRRELPGSPTVLDEADDVRVWSDAREWRWAPPGASIVKVPAADLTPLVALAAARGAEPPPIRFTCGARSAWMAVSDLGGCASILESAGLRGQVVRGRESGALLGLIRPNAFATRLTRVLDPKARFGAASDPRR